MSMRSSTNWFLHRLKAHKKQVKKELHLFQRHAQVCLNQKRAEQVGLDAEQFVGQQLLLFHFHRANYGDCLGQGVERNSAHCVFSACRAGTKGIRPFSKAICCTSMGSCRMSTIRPLTCSIHTIGLSASRLGSVHSGDMGPILRRHRISLDLFCPVLSAIPKNS